MRRLSRSESVAMTRARLLEAAEAVFAENGFGEAYISQLAERAGYTRGAVYPNFAGKDELFLAVLDRWLDDDIERGGPFIADSPSAQEVFEWLRTRGGNRFADRSRFLLLTEFRLYALRNPAVAPRLAEYERRSLAWYTDAIRTHLEGAGIAVPAAEVATLVLALENGIATLAHLAPDDVRHHAFIDALELLSTLAGEDTA